MPEPGPCQPRKGDPLLAQKLELIGLGKRLAWYLIAADRDATQDEVMTTLDDLSAHQFRGHRIGSIRDQQSGRFIREMIGACKAELEFINSLEMPT